MINARAVGTEKGRVNPVQLREEKQLKALNKIVRMAERYVYQIANSDKEFDAGLRKIKKLKEEVLEK